MTVQQDSLLALRAKAGELLVAIEDYLEAYPSPRLGWRRGAVGDVMAAIDAEALTLIEAERKARARGPEAERRKYDPFDLDMAARFVKPDGTVGITVEELHAWRRERRATMSVIPPLDEQLKGNVP